MRGRILVLALLAPAACGRGPEPLPPATDTPPAVERSTDPDVPTIGGIQARRTEVAGIVADLLTARREGRVLTVTVRFRNAGTDTLSFEIPTDGGTYPELRLTAGGRAWPLARGENGGLQAPTTFARDLGPGQSMLWRGSFEAPPRVTRTFDLEMPRLEKPFHEIPITESPYEDF